MKKRQETKREYIKSEEAIIATNKNCRCKKYREKCSVKNNTNCKQSAVTENNRGKPQHQMNGSDVSNKRSRIIDIKGNTK